VSAGFDLVTTRILVPVLFLLWFVRGLAQKKVRIPNRAETWLVVVFLFLSALSLALGRDADAGFRKLLYLFSIFPVFFVAADVFCEKKWRDRGLAAIAASGAIAAAVAFFQFSLPFFLGVGKAVKIWENLAPFFLGKSFGELVAANSSWLVNIGGVTRMRAFGFFPDPHNFAFFVDLCLFVALGYFAGRKNTSRFWLGLAAITMIVAAILSFSRGAYFGLIAGALFFAIAFLKRSSILGKSAVIAGLVLAIVFLLNSNIISQRLVSSFNFKEGSNAERYKNWTQAVEIVRDNPLGGVGLGNYARTVDPALAGDRSSIYAHNLFLDIAAETGILNAIVFLALLLVSVRRGVKNGNALGLGIAAGLVGFAVHSMFDTALYSPQVLAIFLVIIALNLCQKFKKI